MLQAQTGWEHPVYTPHSALARLNQIVKKVLFLVIITDNKIKLFTLTKSSTVQLHVNVL